ncbi:MAG TPA: hypothetical protein VGY58_06345, partial [Gemmataceae bacterium]|nr:hypothetical protein [Gemmataceae bacterium]
MARANFKIAVLIATLLNLALLWPLLHCRYNHDDLTSSCSVGIAAAHNESVWGLTLRTIAEWTVLRGRFFPLAFYHFLLFSVVRGLLVYRIIGMACILGNVFLFALLVGRLTGSRRVGLLAALMAPLAFQFRLFHDPILSFCLLLPLTCALIFGSLLFLDLHLEGKRPWQLVLSISLYVLAILTYEVAWPFFLVHYLLIRLRRVPAEARLLKWRTARPFFAVAGFFVLLTVGVRMVFNVPLFNKDPQQAHLPYAPHLDAGSSMQNFAKQTLAAVPFSYRWFVLRGATVPPVPTPVFVLLLLGVGYPVAAWLTLGHFHDPTNDATIAPTLAKVALPGLCLLGSAILILPATLISLSAEHFRDASWGVGYLPVYISYFGATLLLIAGIVGVMRLVGYVRLLRMPLYSAAAVGVGGLLGLVA